ncbi:PAS domain-containing sensor histidine kinase [Chthonobacter rhizosphaerae]|uniref:PAS domain-containing sensor histidine kinase n=1 Tax=Chthonobacter rhizosphaerae TaxID=2735553 RepID=UPI0015EE7ECB|nr:ATP-binding protein [Chthonobacter rhizosphaerae]
MRIDEVSRALERSFDPLVHGSAAADPTGCARHRAFIAAHLGSGILALALIPLCLVFEGRFAVLSSLTLGILGLEALVGLYVSRTGRLDAGYLASAAVLTLLVTVVALNTGGLSSFALVWFAVTPIEAALSNSRRVIAAAAAIGAAGLGAVVGSSALGLVPEPAALPGGMAVVGVAAVVAMIYGAMIAIRIETQNRDADRHARALETRYRLLADTMIDVVTCHGADADVTFASPAVSRLLGVPPSALMGDGLFRRVHVADRPAYLTALSEAIYRGLSGVQFRLRRGDEGEPESWVWVETLLRRSEEAAAGFGGVVVGVTRDIEHRKAQEAEILKARQDAEAASFAKTRFLANVSHELRTPLNAIIGFSDILGQEIFGKFEYERHREYARLIKDSGEHLLQVVNDILDMSKIEAGSFDVTPEPFDLKPVLDRCGQIMEPQAQQAGVAVRIDVEDNLPELVADRRACRQIALNLLSNAIKFTDRGGEVVCGARRDGRRIALYVKDNGIGIAPEDLPRLGNPFVQADSGYDRRREGTGLGLSVVKGLAALHGGTMTIDSALGVGTTVTVTLPINCDREPTPLTTRQTRSDGGTIYRAAKRA